MSKAGYLPMSIKRLGGRTRHPRVSSSPSKIPYGGFSPVRLQTGLLQRRSSSALPALSARSAFEPVPPTYTPPPALHRTPVSLTGMCSGAVSQDVSSPEALGSPAGSAVPPGHRLLRPHLRLSPTPTDLCIRRRALALRSDLGCPREGPQFTLPICSLRAASRTPADRATAPDCCFIALAGLRHSRTGSASHPGLRRFLPGFLTRLQSSLDATARRDCSPFTDKGFYVRAFTSQVTSKRCRI